MSTSSRRDFLATTSLAFAGTLMGTRGLEAQRLPTTIGRSALAANALLPESVPPMDLRMMATSAIDAAKTAGASYADIRIAERQTVYLNVVPGMPETNMSLTVMYTYGVRVIVDGTWSFVHGSTPSVDAVTASARDAVLTARGYAKVTKQRVELAPAPAATGEWSTPIQVDPFAVPLRDQASVASAWGQAVDRVRNTWLGGPQFQWRRELRVFASSEGSLVTQTLRRKDIDVNVRGDCGMGNVYLTMPRLAPSAGGYETVSDPALQDEFKALCEESVRVASFPRGTLDVGRYPIVCDGATLGAILGQTLGPALELDRVLGYEADASGTSFLSSPADVLNTQIASPLLTITGNRALPSVSAAKWDDDGVEPHEFPVVREGRLVDYQTSRQTAPALRALYGQRGQPVSSHGCAVAPEASDPVSVRPPHLTVAAHAGRATLDDLCRGVTKGLLLVDRTEVFADQQLSSGLMPGAGISSPLGVMYEILQGKITRRIEDNGIQFRTGALLKSLVALGDASTVRDSTFEAHKGMPWRTTVQSATAPAALLKDVDIISTQVQV